MKRILTLSLLVGIIAALIFFLFNAGKLFNKNIEIGLMLDISKSYIDTPKKSLFYGQREYNMQTYVEMLKCSDFSNEITKKFPDIHIRDIRYAFFEDSKILKVTLITGNRHVSSPERIGQFIEEHFFKIIKGLSERTGKLIDSQLDIIHTRMREISKDLYSDFDAGYFDKWGTYYRNYKAYYGNAPIPWDLSTTPDGFGSLNTMIVNPMSRIRPEKPLKLDEPFFAFIYDMYAFNQLFNTAMLLQGMHNESVFISTTKISPFYLLGSRVIRPSKKAFMTRVIIVFSVFFIVFFTLFYVFKKD